MPTKTRTKLSGKTVSATLAAVIVISAVFIALSILPGTPLGNYATGSGSSNTNSNVNPYLMGYLLTPEEDRTDIWENEELFVPLYGTYVVKWQTNSSPLTTSDCQLRKNGDKNKIIATGGLSKVSAPILADDLTTYRGFEPKLYCKLKSEYITNANNDDPYVLMGTGDLIIAIDNCETAFDSIVEGLQNGQTSAVTENSFRSWASEDDFDSCGYDGEKCAREPRKDGSRRSGDKSDIETAMAGGQCQYIADWEENPPTVDDIQVRGVLDRLMNFVSGRFPAPIGFYKPSDDFFDSSAHEAILLGITKSTTSGLRYDLKILDPNGPQIRNFTCSRKTISSPDFGTYTGVACEFPDWGDVFPYENMNLGSLREQFIARCPLNNQTNFCKDRYYLSTWLENNYPQIPNFGIPESEGVCYGWSDFVLRVTYLLDFYGECPRP